MREYGYDLQTADDHPVRGASGVWFWDVPQRQNSWKSAITRAMRAPTSSPGTRDLLGECLREGLSDRLVLFLGEPVVTNEANWDPKNWEPFPVVFTWSDDLVDGSRFVKFVYPIPAVHPDMPEIAFREKRLLANISANKHSIHPAELYSARRSLIRYCESAIPGAFALFGPGWLTDENPYPSYEGQPQNKWDVYPKFRFGLCYENMIGAPGYVTEKIFDCLRAGAVPVYLGAPNISDYVDEEAYIDRRRFDNDEQLIEYLLGVDEPAYKRLRDAALAYLGSERFRQFLPEAFADVIVQHAALM